MWNIWNLWKRFLSSQPKKQPYQKPRTHKPDFETLEWRYGPTPSVEMGLTAVGVAAANPFSQPDLPPVLLTSPGETVVSARSHTVSVAPADTPPGVTISSQLPVVVSVSDHTPPKDEAETQAHPFGGGSDFEQPPFQDLAALENLLFQPSRPRPPASDGLPQGGGGGNAGAAANLPPPPSNSGSPSGSSFAGNYGLGEPGQYPSAQGQGSFAPQFPIPPQTAAPAAARSVVGPTPNNHLGQAALPGSPPGKGASPFAGPNTSGGGMTLFVMDNNNGVVLSPSVSVNDFSTYSVQLDADVIGATVSSYSWDLTNASDASNPSGQSTYRLQFTWASFNSGPPRSDTVKVTVTSGSNQLSESITFLVANTSSPAYSSTQPTTASTWASLLPSDAVSDQQAMGGQGPYYSVGLTDGELQTTHMLPAYNPNVGGLQLIYVSTAASAQPIFTAHYQLSPTLTVPSTITASVTFNGTSGSAASIHTNDATAVVNAGDILQIPLQANANATSLATGRYSYSFQVVDTNANPQTTTYSGSADLLNYNASAFGAGWALAGVERIYSVTGGVILDLGDGQSLWFANGSQSGTFVTPPGDFSTLTQNTTTLVYTRTLPDGTQILFNSSGYQTSVVDRNNNTTNFNYNGSNQLTSIVDLNSQRVTLAYSGNNVTAITDPANRIATLAYSSGQLTSIKDPDGSLWSYTYSSANLLTQLTNPLNSSTTFGYKSGRISLVTRPDGTRDGFTPVQMQGLPSGGGGSSPSSGTGTILPQAPAAYTDPRNNVWDTYIDWLGFGKPTEMIDPLNDTAINHVDKNGLSWMPADPLAHRTRDFFDSKANVLTHVQPDDTTWQYTYNSSFSEVLQTTDPRGNLSTATYDTHGNQTQFKDALGDLTTSTYTGQGFLSTTTDPLGHVSTYSYDSLNRQTTVTDALGNVTTSLYDSTSNLTGSIDARGDRTTYSFDALGRQTQVQDALGDLSTTVYDAAGNATVSIDARGDRTTYSFDKLTRQTQLQDAVGDLTTTIYDAAGNVTTSIDARGDRTTYGFDTANRQTQVQDALGDLTTSLYDQAGNVTSSVDSRADRTTYGFDSLNRQTQVQDALGDLTTSLYDQAGNLTTRIDARGDRTTYSFDSLNRQTQVQDAVSDLTTTIYDAAGNATTAIDARGDRTTYSFDNANRQTQVQDAFGDLSTTVYDPAGNATVGIDQLGHRTTYSFDSLNRQTQVQDALGDLSTTIYDAAGNATTRIDARGDRTTYSFDGLNRQTQVQDAVGDLSTTIFDAAGNVSVSIDARGDRTTYNYDRDNRQTAVTDPLNHTATTVFDQAGNVAQAIDAAGFTMTYSYDKLNRQTTVQDPGTGVTTTVYDAAGNVTNTIDAMGDKTTYVFDGLNRQTQVIDGRRGITTTVFDKVGNTVNVIDPDGNTTTFVYDALNRQTQMTDPLGHSSTTVYDAASRKTSVTDRDGRVINYSYDNINREIGETWVVSGSTVNTLTFSYDAANNRLTAANSAGTYTMGYDKINRMTAVQEPFGLSLTYSYDPASNRTLVQDSLNGVLTSVYDAANRLTSRQFGGTSQTPLRIDLTYTPRNQIATINRWKDLAGTQAVGSSAYSYDGVARLTNLQHANGSGSNIANYTYSYDLASRLTQEQDNGTSITYVYDAANELTGAGGTIYSYDLNGNRTMTGYQTGTGNELTNDGTWTYSYDNEGNLTKKSKGTSAETWYYGYDNANHLTSAKQEQTDGGTLLMQATYVLDALANRLEKDVWTSTGGLTVTRFAYDGENVWADLNGSNQLQMRRLYLDTVDSVFARIDSSGNAAWYLPDHLGSIRIVMNSADTTTDVIAYDAFGNITTESNSSFGDRYKWTGREFDSETGLQYNRARYYANGPGRWTTQDPAGFTAHDSNLYRYLANAPLHGTDPFGLFDYRAELYGKRVLGLNKRSFIDCGAKDAELARSKFTGGLPKDYEELMDSVAARTKAALHIDLDRTHLGERLPPWPLVGGCWVFIVEWDMAYWFDTVTHYLDPRMHIHVTESSYRTLGGRPIPSPPGEDGDIPKIGMFRPGIMFERKLASRPYATPNDRHEDMRVAYVDAPGSPAMPARFYLTGQKYHRDVWISLYLWHEVWENEDCNYPGNAGRGRVKNSDVNLHYTFDIDAQGEVSQHLF